MDTLHYAQEIVKELQGSVSGLDAGEGEALTELLLRSGQIFVAGAGRSGLMGRAFAMRLMQAGRAAHVVGETVTPGIGPGMCLCWAPARARRRGWSPWLKAKAAGAAVVLVTILPDSSLGRLADYTVKLPGAPKDQAGGSYATLQPMASLFEQTLLVFYDAVILRIMEQTGQTSGRMFGKHANLE